MNSIKKIHFLVKHLNEYTKLYDEGNPVISDSEWDDMYFELVNLEKETGLILNNSPTQTISYEVVNELKKSEHNHKMLSLEKTKSYSELVNFVGNKQFLISCKMDGLTCSLTYKNGLLVSAETRGNGLIGEDILHNIKTLPSVPKSIPYKEELVVDGEIICTYENFKPFSDAYKNPRNFASGSIRLLDSQECSRRNLTFVVWDVITPLYFPDGGEYLLDQKLDFISTFGFEVVPHCSHDGRNLTEKIMETFVNDVIFWAEQLSYPIDGAVIKFNSCSYGRSLGETSHHFKNAIAFKFYDEVYPTKLLDIEWTMGRLGTLTPVAIFDPINIDGSIINRASLHNISIMNSIFGEAGPYYLQEVNVYKANMIIPQIASADLTESMNAHFSIPSKCPICGGETKVVVDIDTAVLHCSNSQCVGKLINRLDHFCGKKGLDIKGISKATLEKLIEWGWVESIADIFDLDQYKNDWVKKPGFGVKSVEKILNSIQEGRNCNLSQFIAALGIPLIGATAAKELEKHFKDWESFINAVEGRYTFYCLSGFGAEMHSSLIRFNYDEAIYMVKNFIVFDLITEVETSNELNGKVFVITGKVNRFKNRDELKSKIEALGGKVTGSVSKNTHYLINNDVNSTSSKNNTAKSLGIPILSEDDFIETFGIN